MKIVSWIPVDDVADIVRDMVVSDHKAPTVLNVVHPRPVQWDHVMRLINDAMDAQLPMVPYRDWLAKLEALAHGPTPAQLKDLVCSSH